MAIILGLDVKLLRGTAGATAVTDGKGQGLDADWSIIGFSVEQPLEGAMSVSVIAKPNASTRAPSWMQ